MLGKEGDGRALGQQLALGLGQQGAAGLAAGGGRGLGQQGLKAGVGVAGQAVGAEAAQKAVDAAVGAGDGGQGDGVIPIGQALVKVLLRDLLQREEQGQLLLPNAVDGLHGLGQARAGGHQHRDAHQVAAGDGLPRGAVEGVGPVQGGGGVPGGGAVVDAAHREAVRHQPFGGGVEALVHREAGLGGRRGQSLTQQGVAQGGLLGVEQQAPGGVGVGHRAQLGGRVGVVQGGGAPLVEDQVLGGGGAAGVLHQAQAVHQAVRGFAPEEQPAAGPVIKVKAAAGKGGVGGQAVAAAGALEKALVAGHGPRQGQLAQKVVVRLAEGEHHRAVAAGFDPQRLRPGQAGQHRAAALDGGELYRVGRAGLGGEHPLEGVDEVLGGDGVIGLLPAGGPVGQARL